MLWPRSEEIHLKAFFISVDSNELEAVELVIYYFQFGRCVSCMLEQMKDCKTIKARNSRWEFAFLWFAMAAAERARDVPARGNLVDLLIFATPSEAGECQLKLFISIAHTHSRWGV